MAKTQKEEIDEVMKEFEKMVRKQIEKEGLPLLPDPKTGALQFIDVRELNLRFQISVENLKRVVNKMAVPEKQGRGKRVRLLRRNANQKI